MSTLRERIAALQQRSSSPSASAQASSAKYLGLAPNEGKSLRDKIANFEKRGGTPVPRSSFGLAPPNMDKPSSREMYGNRFVSTPLPLDPSVSRSNSVRSPSSPNSNPKRERRVSSYGDSSWSGAQLAHKRSYSTAGDKLIPMHTGTTSSDEVSSITSSFPATPHDTTSFLKLNEAFKEDPEDYDGSVSSSFHEDTPSRMVRDLPSTSPEVFRNAFDKFSEIDNEENSPNPIRKKKSLPLIPAASVVLDDNDSTKASLPNIVINDSSPGCTDTNPTADNISLSDSHGLPENVDMTSSTQLASPPASPETRVFTLSDIPKQDEVHEHNRGVASSAIIHDTTKSPSRSPSPSPSPADTNPSSMGFQEESSLKGYTITASYTESIFSDSVSPSPASPMLQIKKSHHSLRKLTPVKPPERPISMGLSTPDIMAQFPAVPFSTVPPNPSLSPKGSNEIGTPDDTNTSALPSNTIPTSANSHIPESAPLNSINTPMPIASPPSSQKKKNAKSNPKNSIPGWWDYNSDDEEVGGWATVIVSTRR